MQCRLRKLTLVSLSLVWPLFLNPIRPSLLLSWGFCRPGKLDSLKVFLFYLVLIDFLEVGSTFSSAKGTVIAIVEKRQRSHVYVLEHTCFVWGKESNFSNRLIVILWRRFLIKEWKHFKIQLLEKFQYSEYCRIKRIDFETSLWCWDVRKSTANQKLLSEYTLAISFSFEKETCDFSTFFWGFRILRTLKKYEKSVETDRNEMTRVRKCEWVVIKLKNLSPFPKNRSWLLT